VQFSGLSVQGFQLSPLASVIGAEQLPLMLLVVFGNPVIGAAP
jgi:hypothetical protein